MSRDLLLKNTPRNWARGEATRAPTPAASPSSARLVPTAGERARVEKLAKLRMRAESGSPRARKEWGKAVAKIAALGKRSRAGDPKAARACQILRQSGVLGKSRKVSVSGGEESCGREEILGEFVGDEERLARDAGPAERAASARVSGAYPPNRGRGRGRRARQLRKLVWKASRGDAAAAARLQQVTARLQQRASTGDARATAVLQKVQAMQARAQAAAQPAVAPATTPAYVPPPPVPTANVTYAAPEAEYEDDYE